MESESSTKESTPAIGGVALFSRRSRAIKLNPAFQAGGEFAGGGDESEDDEDFEGEASSSGEENSESGSDEEGDEAEDGESDEDEEESDEEEDDERTDNENAAAGDKTTAATTSDGPEKKEKPLLCSICLSFRPQTTKGEVIQCDKCGLAVHEACYAADTGTDSDSVTSSSSTEPWFCEPCMFGLDVPPFCELCPSRYGAFKRSDVGGGWVHLVCAVYTHGISFGDVEHCSAVSWQEMDYKAFGRKACSACTLNGTDRITARVGVVSQCEAGMCKNFYHITCAQRLGLLVEADSDENVPSSSQVHIEQHFILCKKHNDSDALQRKRELYVQFVKQEEKRLARCRRRRLSEREELKRIELREKYEKRVDALKGTHITLPSLNVKRPRMLHSSAQFLESFAEKAELLGMERKEFNEQFLRIPAEQIPTIPLAFTETSVRYYNHREDHVFDEEQNRLANAKKEQKEKADEKTHLQETHQSLRDVLKETKTKSDEAKSQMERFHSALVALGVKKLVQPTVVIKPKTPPPEDNFVKPSDMPTLTAEEPAKLMAPTKITPLNATPSPKRKLPRILQKRGLHSPQKAAAIVDAENGPATTSEETKSAVRRLLDDTSKPLVASLPHHPNGVKLEEPPVLEPISPKPSETSSGLATPEKKKRKISSPVWKRGRSSAALSTPSVKEEAEERDSMSPEMSKEPEEPKPCFSCNKTTDEHRMIFCVTCQHHYHLACLDPPLTKMPKLSGGDFQCSDCACASESEHEDAAVKKENSPEEDADLSVAERRKSRKRAAAMKEHPRILEAKETARAYKNLMREESRLKNRYLRAKAEHRKSVSPEKATKPKPARAAWKRPASKASTGSAASSKRSSRIGALSPMPTLSPESTGRPKTPRVNGTTSRLSSAKSDAASSVELNGGNGRSSAMDALSDLDEAPPALEKAMKGSNASG